jgi:hypothetical protein
MQKISAGKFHFEPPFTSFDHLIGTHAAAAPPSAAKNFRRAM